MVPGEPPAQPPPEATPRAAGFLRVLGAVLSSFLGIRKRAAGEHDMLTIRPLQVILAAVLAAAILVAAVLVLVNIITRTG